MTIPLSEMTRTELVDEVVRLQQRNAVLAAHAAQLDRPRIKIIGDLINAGLSPEEIPASLARQKPLWQPSTIGGIEYEQ